jgi:hypothetical protein
MTLAPAATKRFSTSRSGSRSATSVPTSKLPEVPMPITGIFSPLDGIWRLIRVPENALSAGGAAPVAGVVGGGGFSWLHALSGISATAAADRAVVAMKSRRVDMANSCRKSVDPAPACCKKTLAGSAEGHGAVARGRGHDRAHERRCGAWRTF